MSNKFTHKLYSTLVACALVSTASTPLSAETASDSTSNTSQENPYSPMPLPQPKAEACVLHALREQNVDVIRVTQATDRDCLSINAVNTQKNKPLFVEIDLSSSTSEVSVSYKPGDVSNTVAKIKFDETQASLSSTVPTYLEDKQVFRADQAQLALSVALATRPCTDEYVPTPGWNWNTRPAKKLEP